MLSNPFVGASPVQYGTGGNGGQPVPRNGADGTEWAVATLVVAALGVLILFRMAGFQAVIAASVGK